MIQGGCEPSSDWLWELRTLSSSIWIVVMGLSLLLLLPDAFTVRVPYEPIWILAAIVTCCLLAGATAAFLRSIGIWTGFELRRRQRR